MKLLKLYLAAAAALLFTGTADAQVPQIINYQGRVVVTGTNFNGTGQFKFAILNAWTGSNLWSNDGSSVNGSEPTKAVPIPVTNGLYNVGLGDITYTNMGVLLGGVFMSYTSGSPDIRLRIWFNDGVHGSQLLSPDQQLDTVPYAHYAARALVATYAESNGPGTAIPYGYQEFSSRGSYQFVFPAGVSRVMVELWGAGGGGVSGGYSQYASFPGAGGGAGGYSRAIVSGTSGIINIEGLPSFDVVVGHGGTGGAASNGPNYGPAGSDGTSTSFGIISVGGGKGGNQGIGGAGGAAASAAPIKRLGSSGLSGSSGSGGSPFSRGSISPIGGSGGNGSYYNTAGDNGQDGYIFITW